MPAGRLRAFLADKAAPVVPLGRNTRHTRTPETAAGRGTGSDEGSTSLPAQRYWSGMVRRRGLLPPRGPA